MVSAAIGMSFTSCSADDVMMPGDETTAAGTGDAYFTVSISMPTIGGTSRADATAESSGSYDQGLENEYAINTVYLYFFDANDQVVTMSNGKKYMSVSVSLDNKTEKDPESPNGTATNMGVQYATTDPIKVDSKIVAGTYKVCALCNAPAAELPTTTTSTYTELNFTTLDELLSSKHSYENLGSVYSLDEHGIPMSSRDYKGTVYQTINISKANTKSSPCSITLYVEREMARVCYTNTSISFPLYKDTSYTTTLGTVVLKQREILNNPATWYTFRHVGSIDASTFKPTMGGSSYDAANAQYGQITTNNAPYVITPSTSEQTTSASTYVSNNSPFIVQSGSKYYSSPYNYRTFNDWILKVSDGVNTGWNAEGLTPSSVIGYVPENCMQAAAQKKGNATCVVFRAEMRPTVAYYAASTTSTSVQAYTLKGSYSGSGSTSTTKVTLDGASEYVYNDSYLLSQDLYFFNGKFYANLPGVYVDNKSYFQGLSVSGVSTYDSSYYKYLTPDNCESTYGVKRYKDHMGYYFYYIRHLDNGDNTVMGPMEFAIVRNNSYDIKINRIAMPAYTLDEAEDINPGEDVEKVSTTMYLDADIVVRPWISRPQTTDLGAR
jgi:hypothetical protein